MRRGAVCARGWRAVGSRWASWRRSSPLIVARPTWASWAIGLVVACAGEAIRVWAAGHIEKGREVTTSGPYRWMRHPLYVGSSVMAAGVMVAARSPILAVVATIYMVATITAAVTSEEAHLRQKFGDVYGRYARAEAAETPRSFSLRAGDAQPRIPGGGRIGGGFPDSCAQGCLHPMMYPLCGRADA